MIRVATLSKTFEHVSRMDDALDIPEGKEDEVFEQWLDGKGDLPLKPGMKPTIFRFARPSPKVHAMIMDVGNRGGNLEAMVTAIELTLREVIGLTVDGGAEAKIKTYTDDHGITRMSAESLELFSGCPELVYELGGRVASELHVKKK